MENIKFFIPEEEIPRGVPLVIALQGFSDAGNTVSQLTKMLKASDHQTLLYAFDNDDFLDYRARRPNITFETDHLRDYDPQTLALYLAADELGAPFLVLSGYEPDFKWNAFVATVMHIIDRLEIVSTTWFHAIPMPVPHTRSIGVTVSGNRSDLIEVRSIWQPTTKLAASIGHVIEHSLYEKQYTVTGFALLVPHYLANTDYPQALITVLECVMDSTGLLFSTEDLGRQQDEFNEQVNLQIAANEESQQMVVNLEARYDDYVRSNRDKEKADSTDLPTGDELADDFERFLAEQWPSDEGGSEAEDS